MYLPPPTGLEKLKQVQSTSNVPPPQIEIGLNMNCYRTKSFQERSSSTFFNLTPPFPVPLSHSMPEQETGEFQFQMDMDMWTQTPSTTPLQPKKNEMLVFGLRSTSDDGPGWSMDSNPIHHPSPARKMKCSFLDYVQLLMIGWAG